MASLFNWILQVWPQEIWRSGSAWLIRQQPDQNQGAARLIRQLPDQNWAATWIIRQLQDQNKAAAWLIRRLPDWSGSCQIKIRRCLINQAAAWLKSGRCLIDQRAARINQAAAWSIRTQVREKSKQDGSSSVKYWFAAIYAVASQPCDLQASNDAINVLWAFFRDWEFVIVCVLGNKTQWQWILPFN